MKRHLLAAAAIAALAATPAAARDNSGYFGIEVGGLMANDGEVEFQFDDEDFDLFDIDYKLGVDGDLIAGYDFGMVRAEAELGYKRAEHDEYAVSGEGTFDADGRTSIYSAMANLLLDFGADDTVNFYAGGGVGMAWSTVSIEGPGDDNDDRLVSKDSNLAWQLIAGVRAPVWTHFDIGLKYRYFDAGNIDDDIDGESFGTDFRSHSLLASLIYNFAPPPPPPLPPLPVMAPPPPPPPPATQTCPDGSVILATDPCPLPPPPPPPPMPEPVRG